MASFLSEHTVEYYIVPRFRKILETKFAFALPIYFWSTREGSQFSLIANAPLQGRLCAVFARRPKFHASMHANMKINAEVFDEAARLRALGIPTFAGMPEISSMLDLAGNFKCLWFSIRGMDEVPSDLYLTTDTTTDPDDRVLGPLNQEQICDLVWDRCNEMSWKDAVNCMREIRTSSKASYSRFVFGATYKPVYFFIFDERHSK